MNWMLAGFQAFDARGRVILSPNVNAVAGKPTNSIPDRSEHSIYWSPYHSGTAL